jgi:hypothetical protein
VWTAALAADPATASSRHPADRGGACVVAKARVGLAKDPARGIVRRMGSWRRGPRWPAIGAAGGKAGASPEAATSSTVSLSSQGIEPMPQHTAKSHGGDGRICFRGDSREPAGLFRSGLQSRYPNQQIRSPGRDYMAIKIMKRHAPYYEKMDTTRQVVYTKEAALNTYGNLTIATAEGAKDLRLVQGVSWVALLPRARDIDLNTAVCVTPRFAMALLFPPKANANDTLTPAETWVYAVFVRSYHNTHTFQASEGLEALQKLYAAHAQIRQDQPVAYATPYAAEPGVIETYSDYSALWPLYAQELATKDIAAEDVIAAVKVHRDWNGNDWTYGCSYNIWKNNLESNYLCTVDESIIRAVEKFIRDEPKTGQSPSRSSGFYRDTEEGRASIDLGNQLPQRNLGQFQ